MDCHGQFDVDLTGVVRGIGVDVCWSESDILPDKRIITACTKEVCASENGVIFDEKFCAVYCYSVL